MKKTDFMPRLLLLVLLLAGLPSCGGSNGDDDDSGSADDTQSVDDTGGDDSAPLDDDTQANDDTGDDDTSDDDEATLPVTPQVLVGNLFSSTEGICAFPDGRMFIEGDAAILELHGDGTVRTIAQFINPVGLAHDGAGRILVADFGPTSRMDPGWQNDGSIVALTPEGAREPIATGISDPNFITVLPDSSFLVSDDYTKNIYRVPAGGGTPAVFLDTVVSPNGMALSASADELYVCQTFAAEASILPDRRVWKVALSGDLVPGTPELLDQLPALSTPDGDVMDTKGRLYVAANALGTIWRIDPLTGDKTDVATGMFGVASLAFGRGGEFPATSLYATQLFGGNIWKLDLGVTGAAMP